jgi:flagella basal body P-ring formation protein FlgA
MLRKPLPIALFVLLAATLPAAEIHLKGEIRCENAIVSLGDIADVYSTDAREAERLRQIELFAAPTGGRTRFARAKEVQELLSLHGIDWTSCRLAGASAIKITGVRVTTAPAPEVEAEVPATARSMVVAASRLMQRGDVIHAVDLQLVPRPERAHQAAAYVGDPNELIGMELTRSMSPGEPIDTRLAQPRTLVERGETITVYAIAPGVRVTSSGRAIDRGAEGDLILVESLDGKRKRFSARVTGVQQATIYVRRTIAR